MIDVGYVLAGTASITLGILLGALVRKGIRPSDQRRNSR